MIARLTGFVKMHHRELYTGAVIFLLVLFAFSAGYIVGSGMFSRACIVLQASGQ